MSSIYRITWRRQLSLLSACLIKLVLFISAYIYFLGFQISHPAHVVLICVYFMLDVLPTVILHLQYFKNGSKKQFIISKERQTVIVQHDTIERIYRYADLERIEYYGSYGGGSGWYSFGEYCFYKLSFKDGYEANLSCMMVKNIKFTLEPLLGKNATKRLTLLPFI